MPSFTLISIIIVIVLGIIVFQDKIISFIYEYKKTLIFGLPLLVLLIILITSIYTVDQTEYAVISTFGKPNTDIIGSGLKFKLPYPIQSVEKLSKETFSTTFGYEKKGENKTGKDQEDSDLVKKDANIHENETKMITGDENIIMADLEIQWKISDPIAYLYNTDNPDRILFNMTSASLKSVIGSSKVEDVLTDGRAKTTNEIRDDLSNLVAKYDLGISIINVNLQDVDLPTKEVDEAFKAVTDAREERLTKINNAKKYRNERINEVKGEEDEVISKAEAEKTSFIEKAKGDTARFNALYREYVNNKAVTKQRLITETLKESLKNAKLYIVDDSSSTVKYLPIDAVKPKEED